MKNWLLSLFLLFAISMNSTGCASQNFTQTEASEPQHTIEDYLNFANELAVQHGVGEIAISGNLPEAMSLYPTMEEWEKYLMENVIPFMDDQAQTISAVNSYGFEPLHDTSVVVFNENANINLFLNLELIDMGERKPYAMRVGNHDEVMLPLEIIFNCADIVYSYDEILDLLTIEGLSEEIILKPGLQGYSLNVLISPWDNDLEEANIIFLEKNEDGFYINSQAISRMIKEMYLPAFPDTPSRYTPLTPLIYHDLSKVVLATHEFSQYPNYTKKYSEMQLQFTRADFPLEKSIEVMFNDSSAGFEFINFEYEEGEPYVISTKMDDYIMLPLKETCELLGLDFKWDIETNSIVIITGNNEYDVSKGMNFYGVENEAVIQDINGILYISHAEIMSILNEDGFFSYISYPEACLYISKYSINF